ncbi:MAG: hypothetical protein ACYSRQ_07465 [Planctomycetota bacterium]|jgi:hypothetical protein
MEKEQEKAFENGLSVDKTRVSTGASFTPSKFLNQILISTLVTITLTGCADFENFVLSTNKDSPSVNKHISTVIYYEIRDPNVRQISDFAVGEVPAVRIQNCPDAVALFKVADSSTGKLIRAERITTRKDKVVYWPIPEIEPGTYIASLHVPGFIKAEFWTFTVGRENIALGIEEPGTLREY